MLGDALGRHQERAAEPVGEQDRYRRRDMRGDREPAKQETQGVVEQLDDNVEKGAVLGADRPHIVDHAENREHYRDQAETAAERVGREHADGSEQNILSEHDGRRHRGLHRRARALGRMHGVEWRVEPFIDGVVRRRQRHRHQQAGQQSSGQCRDVDRPGRGHDHRKRDAGNDQHVLDPVIRPRDGDVIREPGRRLGGVI